MSTDRRIRQLERAASLGDADAVAALATAAERANPLGPRLWPVFRRRNRDGARRRTWHVPRVHLSHLEPGGGNVVSRCGALLGDPAVQRQWSLSAPINDGERVGILPACESCARRPLDVEGWALAVTWCWLRPDAADVGHIMVPNPLDPRRLAEALNHVLGMALHQGVHVEGLHLAAGDAMRAVARYGTST